MPIDRLCPSGLGHSEGIGSEASSQKAETRGRQHDEGKRHIIEEDRHKCQSGQRDHQSVFQGPFADPEDGFQDDCQYSRFETKEEPLHDTQVLITGIQDAQHEHEKKTGYYEQCPCHNPSPGLVQEPSDVRCQLLSFRSGEKHAVIERMKKALFTDPAPFFHQVPVHHRYLGGRTAKAVERNS